MSERSIPPKRTTLASARLSAEADPYLSVAETVRLLNDVLEAQFPSVMFRGEISQVQVAQSGHIYYTIKDEGAQIACVMWAGMARSLTFKLQTGTKVRCHGKPNIYAGSGRFQLVVSRMILDGEGELQRKFLELKARLEQEGFFAPERKRALPFLPKAVGIVTSKTGAVIHDMMVKFRERFPSMPTYLVDTRVQGEGAAQEIASAIRYLDKTKLVDVIIVARGGGSLEDLWAFNEEVVVKAVFASTVPVVSGVGHEVDITLCDLAADVRAPTPTAAAEMVVPRRSDLLNRVDELSRRLNEYERWYLPRVQRVDELSLRLQTIAGSLIKEAALRVRGAEARLSTIRPDRVVALLRSKIELLHQRLSGSGQASLQRDLRRVAVLSDRLYNALTPAHLTRTSRELAILAERLEAARIRNIETATVAVEHLAKRLEGISPRRVLERGFAVVKRKDDYVNSVHGVAANDQITITLHDGEVVGVVERTESKIF